VPATLAQAGEQLSFRLGEEDYGLAILDAREIRSFEAPTRIADAPAAVLGAVNLRGLIVPVVDLRHMFGCSTADVGVRTVIIVLALSHRTIGVVVAAVSDVVEVVPEQLQPPDIDGGSATASRAFTGLACLPARGDAQERLLVLVRAEALAEAVRTH
jgi:purine-binding chemotaxis protein CheW